MNTDLRRGESLSCFAWFVGKNVAQVLGYKNPQEAVRTHVDDEDKGFEMLSVSDSQNGNLIKTAVINESGDYLVCGVQAVKKLLCPFDSSVSYAELPCNSLGCFFGFPQSAILTLCGELTRRIAVSSSLPALGQLSSLLRFRNQDISLNFADIAPPNLVLAHPDDGGETIQKHRF